MLKFQYGAKPFAPEGAGMGRVFYVQGFTGSDTNEGIDPSAPFATIAYALTQCVADHNDYILVLDAWQEDMPIVVNVSRVHIIGISDNPGRQFVCLNAAADTAIFQVDAPGDMAEIAGFMLGGGASHGGIETVGGSPFGVHIHDNVFGHPDAGNIPLRAIWTANGLNRWMIRNNWIIGDGGNAAGTITGNGIDLSGGPMQLTQILDNIIMGVDICINLSSFVSGVIARNLLAPNANLAGGGITLAATCLGNLIQGNMCNYGDTAMGNNPYSDGAAAGANHWAGNYGGGGGLANTPWLLPT